MGAVLTVIVSDASAAGRPPFKVGDTVAWRLFWGSRISSWYHFAAPDQRLTVEVDESMVATEGPVIAGPLTLEIHSADYAAGPLEISGPLFVVTRDSPAATTGTVQRIQLATCVIGDPGTVDDGWITYVPLPATARYRDVDESPLELEGEALPDDHYREQFLIVELVL